MFAHITALLLMQAAPTPATTPPAPPKCDSVEHAQFDFWVGEWEVYPNGSATKVAESTVERLYNGCAVRENWMPTNGADGGSLNSYDPSTGRWNQTWIGSSPGRVEFVGGTAGDGMRLIGYWQNIGGPGKHGLVRMTYVPHPAGWMQQFGEVSYDHGGNWQPSFDFVYRPRHSD